MKWLIALAPHNPTLAPLAWARFLAEAPAAQNLAAVSVCAADTAANHVEQHVALEAYLKEHALGIAFAEAQVMHSDRKRESIETRARELGTDAIVVTRRARRSEPGLVRLGGTPRRLLRRSALPVVVMPCEPPEPLGAGPIVVALSSRDSVPTPLQFAQRLARELGREVECVSVVSEPPADSWAPLNEAPDVVAHRRASSKQKAQQRLAAWREKHGLTDVQVEVRVGSLLEELFQFAEERDSPLLVCGKRRVSRLTRFVWGSTGADLASHTRRPVAVVPL